MLTCIPGQARAPLELTANVATPLPGIATLLKQKAKMQKKKQDLNENTICL